jgi:hypothetical protein
VSYAAAFEVGRLLAAADGRLAQELMRWRRGAYRSSTRQTYIDLLRVTMSLAEITDPLDPVALRYSVDVLGKITQGIGPLVDPFDVNVVLASPLLQPAIVAQAFGLASVGDAQTLLGNDPTLSQPVVVAPAPSPLVDFEQVVNDTAGMQRLSAMRQRALGNVDVTTRGGQP